MDRIGADGDGVCSLPGGVPAYLRAVLPGERVAVQPTARRGTGFAAEARVLSSSTERAAPPCPHFGPCGGCALQHWQPDAYLGWKSRQVAAALRRAGVPDPTMDPIAPTPPGARRRLSVGVERSGAAAVRVGLRAYRSSAVVDMHACPILHPALFAAIQGLRPVLAGLSALRASGEVEMNLLDTGPDIVLRTDGELSAADRSALAGFAVASGTVRVSWTHGAEEPEPACVLGPARVAFAGRAVEPPPGSFLQASAEGEAAIRKGVLDAVRPALSGRARIVELHAGCGTLTAGLATLGRVEAYEGDQAACSALKRAGIPGVTVRQRDLARQPLRPEEVAGASAVVLDPPWDGAAAQMALLATARIRRVAYVSCNPAALARDAAVLVGAGYELIRAVPIDQFLWSARVEAVASFALPKRR